MRLLVHCRPAVVAVFAAAFAAGCGDSRAEPTPSDRNGPPGRGGFRGGGGPPGEGQRAVPVAARIAQPGALAVTLRGTANLQAREQVEILPKQGGIVARVLVEEGTRVAAGQPLAALDDEEWQLQARQAEARALAARDAAERAVALHGQGLLADQELQRLRSEAEVAAADRDLAALRARNAVIRSPISGVVTHRYLERGQLVTPATPAFAVADVSRLEALLAVPEQDAQRLRSGQPALIRVEGSGDPARGRVSRIRPVVDPQSGTVQVTVEVDPATASGLRAGQFVNVDVVTETLADRITLPRTAVLVDGPRPRVFVVRSGEAAEREVVLGANEGDRVEIREGLAPGDTVVIVGQDALRPGTPVRLVELNGEPLAAPAGAAQVAAPTTGGERGRRIEARLRELGVEAGEARALAERWRRGERQEVIGELRRHGIDPRELRPGAPRGAS